MDKSQIPSLTDFNSGEDDQGNSWYAGTFSRNGFELKANNYGEGYSTRWNTNKSVEELLEDVNKFYRLKGSVSIREVSDESLSPPRDYRLSEGDASISDYDFEDVMAANFESDDFGVTWARNGSAIIENDYMLPFNVTVYVNEPVEDIPEPFMEPTWKLLPETGGPQADQNTTDQLTHDAGLFIQETDEFF